MSVNSESVRLVLRLAALDPMEQRQMSQGALDSVCRFCGGIDGWGTPVHEDDCVWAEAVALAAQIDGSALA